MWTSAHARRVASSMAMYRYSLAGLPGAPPPIPVDAMADTVDAPISCRIFGVVFA